MEDDPLALVVHPTPCVSGHDAGDIRGTGGVTRLGASKANVESPTCGLTNRWTRVPTSRESVFLNWTDWADGALIHAAASTQPFGVSGCGNNYTSCRGGTFCFT